MIVPNVPVISGISNVKLRGFFAELSYRGILASTNAKEFHNQTVGKYLNGYNDKFTNLVSKINWDLRPEDVGLLSTRLGSTRKSSTVFTGTDDANKACKYHSFGGQTKFDIWKTDSCNEISGNEFGVYGPLLVQNKENVQLFYSDILRSFPWNFDKGVKYQGKRVS